MDAKNITFRGISLTPSDRNNPDGGCSESLNVAVKDGELMPALSARLSNTTLGLPATIDEKIVFIHKQPSYTNYIAVSGLSVFAYVNGTRTASALVTLPQGESIRKIISKGNTVLISAQNNIHYLLFKEGSYRYLGTEIPRPDITFSVTPHPQTPASANFSTPNDDTVTERGIYNYSQARSDGDFDPQPYGDIESFWALAFKKDGALSFATSTIASETTKVWNAANAMIATQRNLGRFCAPILVRFAVRLFDGSYIYPSVPILLTGIKERKFVTVKQKFGYSSSAGEYEVYTYNCVHLNNVFSVTYTPTWTGISGWEDIVESLDIFISEEVRNPKTNARMAEIAKYVVSGDNNQFCTVSHYDKEEGSEADREKEIFLSKSNFFLMKSLSVNDWSSSTQTLSPISQDLLLAKDAFVDNGDEPVASFGGAMEYNTRLMLHDAKVRYPRGYERFPIVTTGTGNTCRYVAFFFIRTDDNKTASVKGFDVSSQIISQTGSYLCYPNSRCYKAVVYRMEDPSNPDKWHIKYVVDMEPHPFLNIAVAVSKLGMGTFADLPMRPRVSISGSDITDVENREVAVLNKIIRSEVDNPFLFPIVKRTNYGSKIVGIATTTMALSTGQYDHADIYVFGEDGIQAQSVTSDDEFGTHRYISRDVAKENTVSPIDKAIIFQTDKGVMLLEGGQISCLSDSMVGKHFCLATTAGSSDAAILSMLSTAGFSSLQDALTSATAFPEFMSSAKCAYDYSGNRLLFFKDGKSYIYVYLLKEGTWHKQTLPSGASSPIILNSFPDCYVSFTNATQKNELYNFSTPLSIAAGDSALKGVLVSRPMHFDAPDTYKSVERMLLRGEFAKGNVKYILLASNDNINFHVLTSLRGPSWKFFRIVMAFNMNPTDKFSWAEIVLQEKFTDKPR